MLYVILIVSLASITIIEILNKPLTLLNFSIYFLIILLFELFNFYCDYRFFDYHKKLWSRCIFLYSIYYFLRYRNNPKYDKLEYRKIILNDILNGAPKVNKDKLLKLFKNNDISKYTGTDYKNE